MQDGRIEAGSPFGSVAPSPSAPHLPTLPLGPPTSSFQPELDAENCFFPFPSATDLLAVTLLFPALIQQPDAPSFSASPFASVLFPAHPWKPARSLFPTLAPQPELEKSHQEDRTTSPHPRPKWVELSHHELELESAAPRKALHLVSACPAS